MGVKGHHWNGNDCDRSLFYGSRADHLLSDIGYSSLPWSAAPFPAYGGRQLLFLERRKSPDILDRDQQCSTAF